MDFGSSAVRSELAAGLDVIPDVSITLFLLEHFPS